MASNSENQDTDSPNQASKQVNDNIEINQRLSPSSRSSSSCNTDSKRQSENVVCIEGYEWADSLEAFERELSKLPINEKYSYLEALEKAPRLVSIESDPRRFLAFEGNDAAAAAKRFAKYWQSRRDIFGDRAFLPMNLTGDGALEPRDIEFLNCGYLFCSPKHRDGELALVYTPSFVRFEHPGRLKCCFYYFFCMMQDGAIRRINFDILVVLENTGLQRFVGTDVSADLILTSFPLRASSLTLIHTVEKNDLAFFMSDSLDLFRRAIKCPLVISTVNDFTRNLRSKDNTTLFHKDFLPQYAGGELSLPDILEMRRSAAALQNDPRQPIWCAHQNHCAAREPQQYFSTDDSMSTANQCFTETMPFAFGKGGAAKKVEHLSDDLRVQRRRQLNNEASKRKRVRIKQRYANLEHEYGLEMKRQMILKEENARLEGLIMEASSIVRHLQNASNFMNPAVHDFSPLSFATNRQDETFMLDASALLGEPHMQPWPVLPGLGGPSVFQVESEPVDGGPLSQLLMIQQLRRQHARGNDDNSDSEPSDHQD